MLDRALETALKSHLIPPANAEYELFDGAYSPISTFSARIDLAYRLGLISMQFRRDLHLIRKIRNDFAHNIEGCNFEYDTVVNRTRELAHSSIIVQDSPHIRKTFSTGIRGDFQMVVSWILWHLWTLAEIVDSVKPAELEFGYKTREQMDIEQ
jgi:hypothetical protein